MNELTSSFSIGFDAGFKKAIELLRSDEARSSDRPYHESIRAPHHWAQWLEAQRESALKKKEQTHQD